MQNKLYINYSNIVIELDLNVFVNKEEFYKFYVK